MFKKLLSTLLFFPALAIGQVETVHFETICVPLEILEESMRKYGEKPFITSIGHRVFGDEKLSHATVLFMNTETKTWTMVEKIGPNSYCIIGIGSNMKPYFEKKP
jgi:hypothetical protein